MGVVQQNVTFQLADGFQHIPQLHVFHSAFDNSTTDFFRYLGSHPVVNSSITLLVSPNVLYTLSTLNGTKGSFPEPVPVRKAFPFPYADDFDAYAVSSQALYLTDQAGSFEVVPAADVSRGRVVRQMVPQRPVSWCTEAPYAYSVIGDYAWSEVKAAVDVIDRTAGYRSVGGCSDHRRLRVGQRHSGHCLGYLVHWRVDGQQQHRLEAAARAG